jgi:hypothetical protein
MNVDSFRQKTVQSGQGSLMQIFGQIKCLGFGAEGNTFEAQISLFANKISNLTLF